MKRKSVINNVLLQTVELASKVSDWCLKHFSRRNHKQWGGNLVFWVVYDNTKDAPNMFLYAAHPNLTDDKELMYMLETVAERVRTHKDMFDKDMGL